MPLLLLGFDLREAQTGREEWTVERRQSFLIRPEVQAPLSVDRAVWPAARECTDNEYPLRLWRSITQTLKDAPAAVSADGVKPTIIEIEVVINDYSARYWMSTFYGWPRPEEDKRLTLTKYVYGFDVADSYFISGLSNCMLSSVELSYLRTLWSHRINNFGLIPEVTDALEYCQVCDRLIPEHAPFYAFRIQSVDIGLEPPT